MRFVYEFDDLATGTSANTFKTFIAVLVADVAGLRMRVRSVSIGPSDDTPLDENIGIKLKRIKDVSAGSAGTAGDTVAVGDVVKKDTLSADSQASIKTNYSVEPTTYEESSWTIGLNARGAAIKEWSEELAPVVNRDQLIGLLVCPRSNNAVKLSGSIEIESF